MAPVKILVAIILLASVFYASAEHYTDWYVQSTATNGNFNAGSTPDDTPTFAAASGNWTNATGVWFKSGAVTAAITNGAWASIFVDGTTTNTWFVGQITNVDVANNRVWISLVANAGINPANQVGTATIRVGGAWAGPDADHNPSITFPWNFMVGTLTNGPTFIASYNFKNSSVYHWTNAVTLASSTTVPLRISGYSSSPRDGGICTNSGVYSGVSFTLVTISAANILLTDMAFITNGNSGAAVGMSVSGGGNIIRRCFFHGMRGGGITSSGATTFDEVHVVQCDLSGTADLGGITLTSPSTRAINCIVLNMVSPGSGFVTAGGGLLERNIAYGNAGDGLHILATSVAAHHVILNCDFYSNAGSGIDFKSVIATQGDQIEIENCNFFSNGKMGITNTSNVTLSGRIANCSFGSGSKANTLGDIASSVTNAVSVINQVIYPSGLIPWVDPDNFNFSQLASSSDRAMGYSVFFQPGINSPTNTVSYPDIGATQASDTNSAGVSYTFAQ